MRGFGPPHFAACLALLLGMAGCSNLDKAPTGSVRRVGPDEIIEDFQMTETSSGTRSRVLHARVAEIYQSESRAELQGLSVDFFESDGRPFAHLTSDSGTVNQNTNDMRARGHVDIRTTEGVRVEAPTIQFWNQTQRIVSDARVKVTDKAGSVLSGVGFDSDVRVEHYRVGQVNATLKPSDKGPSGNGR